MFGWIRTKLKMVFASREGTEIGCVIAKNTSDVDVIVEFLQ